MSETRHEWRIEEIGRRIKKEREEMGLSQQELLRRIGKSTESHKSLTSWESGKKLPDLYTLSSMADLFGCDIGYLLGDYPTRKWEEVPAHKSTGLSEDAVFLLAHGFKRNYPLALDFLNALILDSKGEFLNQIAASAVCYFLSMKAPGNSHPLTKDIEQSSLLFQCQRKFCGFLDRFAENPTKLMKKLLQDRMIQQHERKEGSLNNGKH